MTTTKLGSAPSAAKLPAPTRTATPVATAAVVKTVATPETAGAPTPVFDAKAPGKHALNPQGEHVPTSADPGSLWGAERRQPNPELRVAMTEFRAMTPQAQKAKIEELKGKQDELSKKMLARIEVLDARYKNVRNVTKAEMLRDLSAQTGAMTPAEKEHLNGLLDKAEGIAKQIEALKAKAATLPDSKTATPAQLAERTALARQIKNARGRLSDATKASTAYVDSLGLRNERLAVNEQKIDPNAPPKESPKSLWGMISAWFSLSTFIGSFTRIFSAPTATDIVKQDVQKAEARLAEEQKFQVRQEEFRRRAEDDTRRRGDADAVDRRAQLLALAQALAGHTPTRAV